MMEYERMRFPACCFAAAVCAALLAFTPAALAATWYVKINGTDSAAGTNWVTAKLTIQAALTNTAAGDTVLVSNGVYSTGGRVVFGSITNRVAIPNAVKVISLNGPAVTTIAGKAAPTTNGNTAVRCVYLGTNAFLSGFTLTNGHTRATGDCVREQSGGGVWCEPGAVVSNCVLRRCSAYTNGGGAYGGTLNTCTLTSNWTANGSGGGAYNVSLINCTLIWNSARSDGGGSAGCTMTNCTLSGNRALSGNGGGAYSGTLYSCTLSGNSAGSDGGGSYNGTLNNCSLSGNSVSNFGGGAGSSVLNNCILSSNSASSGGGSWGGTLFNCTLSGNMATNIGGGSYYDTLNNGVLSGNSAKYGGGSGDGTLNNCTLFANSADTAGGSYGGTLNNCIVYSNSAPNGANYSNGTFHSSCTTPMPTNGDDNITDNPQFVNAAASNLHLKASSPCRDTGNNAYVQVEADMDGNPRIVNGTVDMGAYEYRGADSPNLIWYVATNGGDSAVGTNWATAKQTIHAAIDRTISGDTVLVSNGTYATGGRTIGTWSLTNRVAITNAITVQSANGPMVTTIQGAWDPATTNGDAAVRCVYMAASAALSGFTLIHGATRTNGVLFEQSGGGVCCEDTSAVVTNCILSGNAGWFFGGGSYYGALNHCSFSDNSASYVGGGSAYSTLSNCVLSGNSADSQGGGSFQCLLVDCALSSNRARYGGGSAYDRLNRCVLFGNFASLFGGGSSYSVLSNCLMSGNFANSQGGGSDAGVLNNCVVWGNRATTLGGGSVGSTLNNCVVWSNSAAVEPPNYMSATFYASCTTPVPGPPSTGNITNDPQFVDAATSNFHLKATSPCIDMGSNAHTTNSATDLDGNPRIVHGIVDMGAYEFQGYWGWTLAITNGLTNPDECATGDGYPNLLKYATGSSPTSSDELPRLGGGRTNGLLAAGFNRNTNAADVTVIVEGADAVTNDASWAGIATNLNGSWGDATNVAETGTSNPVAVAVLDPGPATNRFLRLRVTWP